MDNIDFLPERIKSQRARHHKLARCGWLLGCCAAALVLLGLCRQQRIASAQADIGLLSRRCADMQQQLGLLRDLQTQQADLLVKKRVNEDLGSRVEAMDVLAELARMAPDRIAFTALSLEAVAVAAPIKPALAGGAGGEAAAPVSAGSIKERSVNRVRMELTGVAPSDVDVATFIGQLSACPLFEDVNMGYSKQARLQGHSAREFKVTCLVIR